ncbi:tail protein X [Novosphingobium sp.]|uniref:tail protein X n=1 Tax=Novosphingobium sp. TaxID=1874826 RepID=UPI0025838906|nr:tail protein X [Novosphingobium sp.]
MPRTVTARQGDTIDAICWRVLGTTAGGVVEAELDANPGLAVLGPFLPEGTAVILPDLPGTDAAGTIPVPVPVLATVNLWD